MLIRYIFIFCFKEKCSAFLPYFDTQEKHGIYEHEGPPHRLSDKKYTSVLNFPHVDIFLLTICILVVYASN